MLLAPVIPDSPPPYSEIDPAQNESQTATRPTYLELGMSQENKEGDIETETMLHIPTDAASRDEEEASNAILGKLTLLISSLIWPSYQMKV